MTNWEYLKDRGWKTGATEDCILYYHPDDPGVNTPLIEEAVKIQEEKEMGPMARLESDILRFFREAGKLVSRYRR